MGSQYCQPSDLVNLGINPLAFTDVTTAEQTAACIAASARADSYLNGRYTLPLLAWGQDITMMTAYIAVYIVMGARGYSPGSGADAIIESRYLEAIKWFEGIQRQSVHPIVTPSVLEPGDAVHDLPQVQTSPQRGWLTYSACGKPSVGW
jgi:phage gp36-like protein